MIKIKTLKVFILFFMISVSSQGQEPAVDSLITLRENFQRLQKKIRDEKLNNLKQRAKNSKGLNLPSVMGAPLVLNFRVQKHKELKIVYIQIKIDELPWVPITVHEDEELQWQSIELKQIPSGLRALMVEVRVQSPGGFMPFMNNYQSTVSRAFLPLTVLENDREIDLMLDLLLDGWTNPELNLRLTRL